MLKQTSDLICPHCGTKQDLDLFDYLDNMDMEGKFTETCESCEKVFKVEFKLLPYVGIEK